MESSTLQNMDTSLSVTLHNTKESSNTSPDESAMLYPEYKYFDTAINGWDHRNHVRSEFVTKPEMQDTGRTIFRFPEIYLDYFRVNRSVKGYRNSCFADFLPIDIDSTDLNAAFKDTTDFLHHLETQYDISLSQVFVWFSGAKGFHIEIPIGMLGEVDPSEKLPFHFKRMVESIWTDWNFDMSIYDINRLFRSENTINSKTGLYKIYLPNILEMDMKTILDLAKRPGPVFDTNLLYDVEVSERLAKEFESILNEPRSAKPAKRITRKPNWESLLQSIPDEGNRNNTAFEIARGMRMDNHSMDSVQENLKGWNKSLKSPLDELELKTVIKSVFSKPPSIRTMETSQDFYPRSDTGNAELFADVHKGITRFDHTRKKWFIYNDQYWVRDETEQIYHLAKVAARKLQELAIHVPFEEERKKALSWAIGSENLNRIKSALQIASSISPIAVKQSDWANNDYLIQFENGVYDLKTSEFRDGLPEDMNFQSTGYEYDAEAACPIWEEKLLEMMKGDSEMVSFLQRAIGYSLTGVTSEQCLFFLTGDGSNGKSVVLDTLLALLGGYANHSPFSTFEAKDNDKSNDLARLVGTRLVSSSESSQTRRLNEERIKAITGSDQITARFLYQEYFTYTPQFKIWLAVNSLPEIRGTDNGIWRRIKVIPFDVSFKGREDRFLTQKLRKELPGIMNWAIRGATEWMSTSLSEPKRVAMATDTYRSESDTVAAFLEEKIYNDPALKVSASVLFAKFREYCHNSGIYPMTQAMFGSQMRQLDYDKKKSGGTYWYIGITLQNPDDVAPPWE